MKKAFLLLMTVVALQASAQVKGSWGFNGGLYFNGTDVLSGQLGIDYNWRLNQHWMLSAGSAILGNAVLDPVEKNVDDHLYYEGEKGTVNLIGDLSATFTQHLWRGNGVYARGSFQFDLFPFQSIGLKCTDVNDGVSESYPSKFVFTGFSPGVFGEAGVYHDFRKHRMFVGFGYGTCDLFHTYHHNKVAGMQMRQFAPWNDTYYRVTFRLIGL